jgi:hypothetical protein
MYYTLFLDGIRSAGADIASLLPLPLIQFASLFALYLEAFGGFLFCSPVKWQESRLLGIFLFVSLHMGIITTLRVGFFPYMSISSFLALLPPVFWDKLFQLSIFQKPIESVLPHTTNVSGSSHGKVACFGFFMKCSEWFSLPPSRLLSI